MTTDESARILKSSQAHGLRGAVAFNFDDIQQRCDEHVERIRAKTREMLEQAQAEADAIRRTAAEEGRKQGRTEGLQDAAAQIESRASALAEERVAEQLATALPALQQLTGELNTERQQWLESWEEQAIRLTAAMAGRIVHREITRDPTIAQTMIAAALEVVAGVAELTVHLHPQDVEMLGERANEYLSRLAGCREVRIVADPQISPGGALIETQHGQLDARVDSQLDRIVDELLQ